VTCEVIILAAGQGTRMRSKLPKVLHSIAGKPMLEHVIDTSNKLGANFVHVVIGHGANQVKESLPEASVTWAIQKEQLGTGHAVEQALPSVSDDSVVLIAYGDVPLVKRSTLEQLISAANVETLALLTVKLEDPTGYGRIVRDDNGAITAIVEQKDANKEQLLIQEINTGILATTAASLKKWLPQLSSDNAQGEYYLTDIISMAVNDGVKVIAQHPENEWEVQGVNNRIQLSELERLYQSDKAQELMVAGATLADPSRIDVRGEVTVGQDVFIDVNCVFVGNVQIADNVTIGPNCVIENATLGAGATIKANTVIENATVSEHCDVGPFARLRPGTYMHAQSRVGNFVELKNTQLGQGSKVNHLAYVGDAELGSHCNVGAGTITCNYDGANKFKTSMGDNVFIGSNSTLVAPLTIENNGFVGAGSTVTKTVAEKQLAIARAKQKNISGWERPVKKK